MISPSRSACSGLALRTVCFDPLAVQALAEQLGDLDRHRPHQHRLARLVPRDDLVQDGGPLAVLGLVDLIVAVVPDHRHVGRDLDHRELVDLHELGGLGDRRARHPGQLVVHPEVVLERDRGQRLVLLLDPHALLGLDRLVQALRPAPALEDAAGELVDDLDLAVDHRVVDVALVERLGLQRLVQVVDQVAVLGPVEVLDAHEALGLGHALLADRNRLVLLVELEVEVGHELLLGPRVHPLGRLARLHLAREAGELVVEVGRLLGGAGDDQRRARLVDEDVVDLVDDRVRMAALDLLLQRRGHVVAQVVEPELGVGAVGDVGRVGRLLVLVGLHVLQHADRHAQHLVDRAHPLGVAAGQVVVDRDHVDARAGEGVEDHREGCRQGLALAGAHLGDGAVVEHHPADQLHVEVPHAHAAAGGLAHQREGLGQQVVEGLALAGAFAELVGVRAELGVVQELHLRLEAVDPIDALGELLELLGLAHPKGAFEDRHVASVAAAAKPLVRSRRSRSACATHGAFAACRGAV